MSTGLGNGVAGSVAANSNSDHYTITVPNTMWNQSVVLGGIGGQIVWSNSTPSGTQVDLKQSKQTGINPALVFRFVKSKLNKVEAGKLKEQAKKLQKFVKDAKDIGQQATYEELAKMLTGIVGLLELEACGFDKYVSEETVKKFEYKVQDRVLRYGTLESFPRAIPDRIRRKIKQVQAKNLFTEYWILYLDYAKETFKTNKDKIREKDPILFGKIANNPDKLFYIVDWVDEYCDLTLKKFVEEVKSKDKDFEMTTLPELDDKFLADLKKEVQDRDNRLKNTAPSNFRQNMAVEDQINAKKDVPKPAKPWYKFW
jgi:hypothetical protein